MSPYTEIIENIRKLLNYLFNEIRDKNAVGLTDNSVFAENFIRIIFNKIMGWNLININAQSGKSNVKGIDLIEYGQTKAIQVSARDDKRKLEDMIKAISEEEYLSDYQIYYCYLNMSGKKLRQYNLKRKDHIIFDNKKDIIDGNKIISILEEKDNIQEVRRIEADIKDYLGIDNYNPIKLRETATLSNEWNPSLPENYIERSLTCDSMDIERKTDDRILQFVSPTYHPMGKLIDFITHDVENVKENRFIIYNSAQCGKTTELYQLGKELKKQGLCPIFIKAAEYDEKDKGTLQQILLHFYEEKAVLMIDGFDEVSDSGRKSLLKEVENLEKNFQQVRIVVTCRENFKTAKQFEGYVQLSLLGLSQEQIRLYLHQSLSLAEATEVEKNIESKRLYPFVCIPFYLNALVEYYKCNHCCPELRKELYEFWIERAFFIDDRCSTDIIGLRDRIESKLMGIAMVMQITESQNLLTKDILGDLKLSEQKLEECFHLTLFQKKNDRCSFEHNAFKEYYAATYLSKLSLTELKKFVCYNDDPNGKIRESWYNTVLLTLSIKEKGTEYQELLNWIMEDDVEIMINIDPFSISDPVKFDILKKILGKFKFTNTAIEDCYIKPFNISQLCNFFENAELLVKEVEMYHHLDPYLYNLMEIIRWIDFDLLVNLFFTERYDNAIFNKIEELGYSGDKETEILYIAFHNKHFEKTKYIDKLINLQIQNLPQRWLECILRLIDKTQTANKYLSFILENQSRLYNFRLKDNYIRTVDHNITYKLIASINTVEAIQLFWKALKELPETWKSYNSSFDTKKMIDAIKSILELSATMVSDYPKIKHTITQFWKKVYFSEDYGFLYIHKLDTEFQKIFNQDFDFQELIKERDLLRRLYANKSACSGKFKLFRYHIAMHAIDSDITKLFNGLQKNDIVDYTISCCFKKSFSKDWNNIIDERIRSLYPTQHWPNFNEQELDRISMLLDYESYKKHIETIIKELKPKNNMNFKIEMNENVLEKCNSYDYDFFRCINDSLIKTEKSLSVKDHLEDINWYEYFVLSEVKTHYDSMNFTHPQITIINEYIYHQILSCTHEEKLRELLSLAITFDTNLPTDTLLKCIPYASCRNIKRHYNDKGGYLLEYIEQHVDIETIFNDIPLYLKEANHNENDTYCLIKELSKHKRLSTIDFKNIFDIINHPNMSYGFQICKMIEENYQNIDNYYKAFFSQARSAIKIDFASYLYKDKDNHQWLKVQFEKYRYELKNYNFEHTRSFLLALGDEKALSELLETIKKNVMEYGIDHLTLNYNDIHLLPQMKELLNIAMFQEPDKYSDLRSAVLSSLELMSAGSKDNMNTICQYLASIIKPEINNYLHNTIRRIKNNFYKDHSKRISIIDAVKMIS